MTKPRRPVVHVDGDNVAAIVAEKRMQDNTYVNTYTKKFLNRLKNEPTKKILCSKALAPYFGTTYTALFNTVPVTVKFNGTEQEFPEPVANWLLDKFLRVTDSNTPKIERETL